MNVSATSGRLRQADLSASDRNYSLWIHLSPLLAFLVLGPFAGIVPLVLWLARRDSSAFADDHGREVVNMSITGTFLFIVGLLTGVGMLLWLIWGIFALIGIIRGAVAANAGEYFRYPMTIRFLS